MDRSRTDVGRKRFRMSRSRTDVGRKRFRMVWSRTDVGQKRLPTAAGREAAAREQNRSVRAF